MNEKKWKLTTFKNINNNNNTNNNYNSNNKE